MEGWLRRFLAETELDRVSRVSLAVQGLPKSGLDNIDGEILARQADMEICIFTTMNASPDVLQQLCSS